MNYGVRMFKKSRRKIVAAIMSVLVVLWVGTLGVIYASSYFEMTNQNKQMLLAYAEMYELSQNNEDVIPPEKPMPNENPNIVHNFDRQSPMFRLSNFYTVAVSYEGEVLEIKNEPPTIHSDEELVKAAQNIIKNNKLKGNGNLAFSKTDKGGYMLVTFMDNTVINEGAGTLLRYTMIFGAVALVLFFFLSIFLAKKIVHPLEETYRKQKRFISDAGHELKTPIAVVGANAELLTREIGDNQWLQNIQYENERMGILVGQLLDLARTENIIPKTEHIDFSRVVSGEALPFESFAFEKGIVLNCNITDGIEMYGNVTQLKQIVSILLDNAVYHSKSGDKVYLSLTKEHGFAKLSVINKGKEIPPEERNRIFERFYRADDSRTEKDGHYGLGLAIAKAITVSHKGSIGVHCFDGFVEFKVKIPILKN